MHHSHLHQSASEFHLALIQHDHFPVRVHQPDRTPAVVGEPDETWGQRVEAHLVTKTKYVAAQEVLDFCLENDLIPKSFLPKVVHFHDHLPTGPTGKLYRRGLRGAVHPTQTNEFI